MRGWECQTTCSVASRQEKIHSAVERGERASHLSAWPDHSHLIVKLEPPGGDVNVGGVRGLGDDREQTRRQRERERVQQARVGLL